MAVQVPEGWKEGNLSDLISLQSGFAFKSKDQTTGGLRWLKIANVGIGSIKWDEQSFLPSDFLSKHNNFYLNVGDMVVAMTRPTLNGELKVGRIEREADRAFLNQRVAKILTKPNACEYFVFQYLRYYRTARVIDATLLGTDPPNLSVKILDEIILGIPPLSEQQKIAQILSIWDKAITTTEQLLANSQQQKKALMQQLLTGKKRLLDDNGQRFSGEWKSIRLKEILKEEKARNKDNLVERVLSVTNHSGFVLPEEQFSKRVASDNVNNYKVVKKGQYGYNPSRLNVGSFARLDSFDEGLLSPMYVVFSVNEKFINSDYFMNWMNSNEAKQRISGSTQGSVRESVSFDALCSFPFKLPPKKEQQKIATVLTATNQEIATLKQKLEHLKQEKKALMQQLLTGKRRVKVTEVA